MSGVPGAIRLLQTTGGLSKSAHECVPAAGGVQSGGDGRTVNGEFAVEIASDEGEVGREIKDLAEMNRLFTAWVENVYHRRVHSETKQEPLQRWMAGAPFPVPQPADLAEAFRWSEYRRVAKTATACCTATATRSNPSWSATRSSSSSPPRRRPNHPPRPSI